MFNFAVRDTLRPSGPGNNIFSKDNVINKEGEITLKVDNLSRIGWSCAEIHYPAKQGIYEMDIEVPCLPKGIVCGIFLYKDDQNEIDIEFGRWGKVFSKNCQFVRQHPFEINRFWNFKRNNHLVVEYKDKEVTMCVNNHSKTYKYEQSFPELIINLWIYGKPAKAEVKIKNLIYNLKL